LGQSFFHNKGWKSYLQKEIPNPKGTQRLYWKKIRTG
jgi:hypothetical protein